MKQEIKIWSGNTSFNSWLLNLNDDDYIIDSIVPTEYQTDSIEIEKIHKATVVCHKEEKNQDIIDFRYELINLCSSDSYYLGVIRNDGTNDMTNEKKKVLNDILIMFNNHFSMRGYDLG